MEETYTELILQYLKANPNININNLPKQILLIEEDDRLVAKITMKVESIDLGE